MDDKDLQDAIAQGKAKIFKVPLKVSDSFIKKWNSKEQDLHENKDDSNN